MRSRKRIKRNRYTSKKPIGLLELYQRDGGICAKCGLPVDYSQATRDHHIPKSRGGSNKRSNLNLMCATCNRLKANTIPR